MPASPGEPVASATPEVGAPPACPPPPSSSAGPCLGGGYLEESAAPTTSLSAFRDHRPSVGSSARPPAPPPRLPPLVVVSSAGDRRRPGGSVSATARGTAASSRRVRPPATDAPPLPSGLRGRRLASGRRRLPGSRSDRRRRGDGARPLRPAGPEAPCWRRPASAARPPPAEAIGLSATRTTRRPTAPRLLSPLSLSLW